MKLLQIYSLIAMLDTMLLNLIDFDDEKFYLTCHLQICKFADISKNLFVTFFQRHVIYHEKDQIFHGKVRMCLFTS